MEFKIVRPPTTYPMSNSQESLLGSGTSSEEIRVFVLKNYLSQYLEESLRQSRQTFNLSIIAIFMSLVLSVGGGVLCLLGKTAEGSVAGATGAITGASVARTVKDSKEKMERSTKELNLLLDVKSKSDEMN